MKHNTTKRAPVVYTAVSETSCPSGWAETAAKSDNLAACIRNQTWIKPQALQIEAVDLDKLAAISK